MLQPTYHGYGHQQKKKEQQEKPGQKATRSFKPTGIKNLGHGETIKLHLRKKAPGQDWTHIMPKDDGPDIGKCYKTPRCQETMETNQAGRSPLTEELLAPAEHVTTVLNDQYENPEIEQAVAHIPLHTDPADIEMEDATSDPRSVIRAMMLTSYGTPATLCWARPHQLQPRKTSCLMKTRV